MTDILRVIRMIKGIGIDLVEIARIEKALQREGFLHKYFTEKEILMFQEHNNSPTKIAGNFSTKEAIVKMFGTGFRKVRLDEIEILRDNFGKPTVNLMGGAIILSSSLGIDYIHVSISNTDTHVTAVAIGENVQPGAYGATHKI